MGSETPQVRSVWSARLRHAMVRRTGFTPFRLTFLVAITVFWAFVYAAHLGLLSGFLISAGVALLGIAVRWNRLRDNRRGVRPKRPSGVELFPDLVGPPSSIEAKPDDLDD